MNIRKNLTTFLIALGTVAMCASAHAQDIDLLCAPYMIRNDQNVLIPAPGSVTQSNLPVHIHLGDKPTVTLWNGEPPARVTSATPTEIWFTWETEFPANGYAHMGKIDRQDGWLSIITHDLKHQHVYATCLPVKRLF
jgi:hypothetical protein